jgi:hypothetical protein
MPRIRIRLTAADLGDIAGGSDPKPPVKKSSQSSPPKHNDSGSAASISPVGDDPPRS